MADQQQPDLKAAEVPPPLHDAQQPMTQLLPDPTPPAAVKRPRGRPRKAPATVSATEPQDLAPKIKVPKPRSAKQMEHAAKLGEMSRLRAARYRQQRETEILQRIKGGLDDFVRDYASKLPQNPVAPVPVPSSSSTSSAMASSARPAMEPIQRALAVPRPSYKYDLF